VGAFLAGAAGGLGAGVVDAAVGASRAATFLPNGRFGFFAFVCALYLVSGALVCGTVCFIAGAIVRGARAPGGRWIAVLSSVLAVAAAHGIAMRFLTEAALTRFHNRMLIATLMGVGASTLAIALALIAALLERIFSPLMPIGPEVQPRRTLPRALFVAGLGSGFWVAAAATAALVYRLQQAPGMNLRFRAINVGLWAPLICIVALVLAMLAARFIARRADGTFWDRPLVVWLVGWLVTLGPIAIAIAIWWATLKQLDVRPWLALLAAALVASALMGPLAPTLARVTPRRRIARNGLIFTMLVLCLLITLSLGGRSRIRKAASSATGIAPHLIAAIHAATDFDRDGYSALLGGGDCNDFDARVHPGAFDWPDDGIDQDCNGHEATLGEAKARTFAPFKPAAPLNIVLITIDALRADHVGAYGYGRPTTPVLDALARDSALFKNGWAHAPSTRYSVPAILTGRYPSTIAVGSAWWPPNVLPENHLVAEMLKSHGYTTAAFLPYYYFNRSWGLDQGFDEYDIHLQTLHSMGGDPAATHGSSARQLADSLVAYVEKPHDAPFFLWGHFYDTHFHFERHDDVPETRFGDRELDLYDGEIRFTDIQIGRVFDALKHQGLWDRTVVIVTADHGEGFGEHGIPPNRRHGYHLYRTETKVPYIIRVPGLAPRVIDNPVGHVDLVPTILNLVGAAASDEPQLLGDSLVSLLSGETAPSRPVFQEVWYEGPTSKKAVVTDGWHLIRNLVPEDTTELYDQRADPAEDHDVADEGHAEQRELDAALAAWMDAIALPWDFRRRVEGNVSQQPIAAQQPDSTRVGDVIEIAGVDVETPKVKPGEEAHFAMVLHALKDTPPGWRLFTHVIGPGGRRINADHEPLEGLYPLAQLRAGTWLRDRVTVMIPKDWPPGTVFVDAGLWKGNARMPVTGPSAHGDAARVVALQVMP
jgi:arylsulfatase A-like enzyme